MFQRLHGEFIFQQDNHFSHNSNLAKTYIRGKAILLSWPARSPDLSIIENAWTYVKQVVREKGPTTKEQLLTVVQEAWMEMPQEYVDNLFMSIPRRLQMVIDKQGENIPY